ncbi:MAG: DUF4403 family protein [Sphingopyxis sp.]|uniref:DUF4403 family protein n=1 Tax=Sphingopyxis sp. TaxID=1908224 RepID=UPI002AB91D0B|nr:DUF4403 family protein [Sphingopyxis sp.]MDZ3833407.1 DUF4403 family protein [Sphingopyxis sp.]
MRRLHQAMIFLLTLTLTGCDRKIAVDPPPRAVDAAPTPQQMSLIAVPIDADAGLLRRALERAIPRILWTIDRREKQCVPPQRLKVFGRRVKVTPAIPCTIVGRVTRGELRLRGEGNEIIVDMPLNARIAARDIGGILKGETATGAAMAHTRIRIDLDPDWRLRGKARISYGWTRPPGIDFLGQRITFTDEANEKLAPVVRDIERETNREIAKIPVRNEAADIWRQSFTTLSLNRDNPPVWMRVTPRRILYGGHGLDDGRIHLKLAIEGVTESFVGDRPNAPAATPLPPLERGAPKPHLDVFIPVVADYDELEPVILRALVKRSRRPFDLPKIGPVTAKFSDVTAYGSPGGRIAVGVSVEAQPQRIRQAPTHGRLWATAIPVNAPGSPEVHFTDLKITGDTDGISGDLLIKIGQSPGFSAQIAAVLTQNFARDIAELEDKIRHAVDQRRKGDFLIRTRIDGFEIGQIAAYGNGLYLPVRMTGSARVAYRPPR